MANRQQILGRVSNLLAKYYGLRTTEDIAARIALDRSLGTGDSEGNGGSPVGPDRVEAKLISLLIDTVDGALPAGELFHEINMIVDGDDALRGRFATLFQGHHTNENSFVSQPFAPHPDFDGTRLSVADILGVSSEATARQPPDRLTNRSIMIGVINSPYVSLQRRNALPVTIFLNGIPNVELMRAVPFVDVQMFFPRGPLAGANDGRIQTLGLPKLLAGAERTREGSVLHTMVGANSAPGSLVSSRNEEVPDVYSLAGMEIFTSPQTLVNADNRNNNRSLRATDVLDNLRPFLSLGNLSITIESLSGFQSYKTGKLELILHDRSRLSDVAELVKADLYGGLELQIEYGWSHPDPDVERNPYGALIDAMRVKERYGIRQSQFTFDDSGAVKIILDIMMRGGSDFHTTQISTADQALTEALDDLRILSESIAELRRRAFGTNDISRGTQEIRGMQILNAAEDATSNTLLTGEMRTQLRDFQAALRTSSNTNPNVAQLLGTLRQIYGVSVQNVRNGTYTSSASDENGSETAAQRVSRTVVESIRLKMEEMMGGSDPFLLHAHLVSTGQGALPGYRHIRAASREHRTQLQDLERTVPVPDVPAQAVSLGKLMAKFIAEPLAATGKYDEVQMFFYPFNGYAAKASATSIANFIVDTRYFAREFARYRLTHLSRSGNMTLAQFMQFLTEVLLDDPAALSYGITTRTGPLFQAGVVDRQERAIPSGNAADHQLRLDQVLRQYTPDGSWRMPQVDLYVEALPERRGLRDGEDSRGNSGKTILRLHVVDRLHTCYETFGSLLSTTRDAELASVGTIPDQQDGNESVNLARQQAANAVLARAESLGLLERVRRVETTGEGPSDPPEPTGPDTLYRITGGQRRLKEFIMQTVPYVIFGAAGSTVQNATLSSQQDAAMSSINMLRTFRRDDSMSPSGEQEGGLPMRVIAADLTLGTAGNPFLEFMQQFFCDFQTGTTADNFYSILSIEHKFTDGKFESAVKMVPQDAYGQYFSLLGKIGTAIDILRAQEEDNNR